MQTEAFDIGFVFKLLTELLARCVDPCHEGERWAWIIKDLPCCRVFDRGRFLPSDEADDIFEGISEKKAHFVWKSLFIVLESMFKHAQKAFKILVIRIPQGAK